MGANMALHLRDCGHSISCVFDTSEPAAKESAAALECKLALSLEEVGRDCEVIITVVTDDSAMDEIFSEEKESLLNHAEGKLFLNCATISPDVHRMVEKRIIERGGGCLECCMASSITQARNGTLYLMVGGDRNTFEDASPLLQDLSKNLRFVGPSGKAAEVKALVNMVMNVNTAALAEGLGIGCALGLDLEMLVEVFSQTGANSRVLETDAEDMLQRDHECYFSAEHAAKDSRIALALAKESLLQTPLAQATLEQYEKLVAVGLGSLDKSGIAELTFPGRSPALK